MNNVYLIDKPEGFTSFDVVRYVKKSLGIKKVGHTGTLDPFATGLLIVCTGNFTRLTDYFHQYLKTYKSTFVLGEFRDTDDITGEVLKRFEVNPIPYERVVNALKSFEGEIEQLPPFISAKKVNGERLYKLNRKERKVEPEKTRVYIKEIKILSYNFPEIEVEITCGTGTYIRSIARDLGEMLNCGCYVKSLRRTKIGNYSVENAGNIENLKAIPHKDILPHLDAIVPDEEKTKKILSGNEVFLSNFDVESEKVRVFSPFFRELLSICEVKKQENGVILKPEKVFKREIL
ncbi:tRNA pseudouridine55 synthase [Thermotomaculum hydrothermale]|uniref:tRNA pseudouridine synthase B n=1 Tax=Thermotomaculum hydrothermale TaxID=981385 RepID=A0A7R6PPT1_9BACT|nr:tRNA pseudouridine(55) synthase TruB [Thermotomaculum hydrothermale]BBB33593.1 tRNA pseudouridine55 synthase [Thermotomaculum hydrothermale]